MCGRYASSWNPLDLGDHFAVERIDPVSDDAQQAGTGSSGRAAAGLPPDWNVAPTKTVYAVLERCRPDDLDARPVRRLRPVRWGLVPSWAKDISVGNRMFNARAESLTTKAAFRTALARRRCLIPASGYYEWKKLAGEVTGGSGRTRKSVLKQPYYLTRPTDR